MGTLLKLQKVCVITEPTPPGTDPIDSTIARLHRSMLSLWDGLIIQSTMALEVFASAARPHLDAAIATLQDETQASLREILHKQSLLHTDRLELPHLWMLCVGNVFAASAAVTLIDGFGEAMADFQNLVNLSDANRLSDPDLFPVEVWSRSLVQIKNRSDANLKECGVCLLDF
jgi:hypothetical protein